MCLCTQTIGVTFASLRLPNETRASYLHTLSRQTTHGLVAERERERGALLRACGVE